MRGGKLFIPYLLPEHYCGIEPERWLIEEGIKNELGEDMVRIKRPQFDHNTDFNLKVFNREFDFILAQSIFSHASSKQIDTCLSNATNVMKPTSLFVATFVIDKENYCGDEWVYPGCVSYTLDYVEELVGKYGLVCKPIDWPHPGRQTWMVITYPDNVKAIPLCQSEEKLSHLKNKVEELQNKLTEQKRKLKELREHPFVRAALRLARLFGRK